MNTIWFISLFCCPSCVTWPGGLWLRSNQEKFLYRKCPLSATVAPRVRVWIFTWNKTSHHVTNSHLFTRCWSYCLSNFLSLLCVCVCVCVCVCDDNDDDDGDAGSEPTRRVTCGQGTGLCVSASRRSEDTPAPRVLSLRETVFWSRFCCANAILLVSINIFLYAYFAWGSDLTSGLTLLLNSCQRFLHYGESGETNCSDFTWML